MKKITILDSARQDKMKQITASDKWDESKKMIDKYNFYGNISNKGEIVLSNEPELVIKLNQQQLSIINDFLKNIKLKIENNFNK